jgi:outer membrane lipoprotein SlyB
MRKLVLPLSAVALVLSAAHPAPAAGRRVGFDRGQTSVLRKVPPPCRPSAGTTGSFLGGGGGVLVGRETGRSADQAAGTVLGAALGALLGRPVEPNGVSRCH